MGRRRWLVVALVAVAGVLIGGMLVFAFAAPRLLAIYEDVVLDNSSHGRSCAELPTERELAGLLERNASTVATIRGMDPEINAVTLEIGQPCPDGYDLQITYSSHRQREQIETLIRGTELEGAPINWRNI